MDDMRVGTMYPDNICTPSFVQHWHLEDFSNIAPTGPYHPVTKGGCWEQDWRELSVSADTVTSRSYHAMKFGTRPYTI